MRRYARLALAVIFAAGLGAASLLPAQTRGASALDFWSWDGTVRGEGSAPRLNLPGRDGATTVDLGGTANPARPARPRGR
jgi:hypothetical protein